MFTVPDGLVCAGAAVAFATLLTIQCTTWLDLRRSLEHTLSRSTGCLSMSSVRELRGTALRSESTPFFALLVQGNTPKTLLLPGNECKRARRGGPIMLDAGYARPRNVGWFDLTKAGMGPE